MSRAAAAKRWGQQTRVKRGIDKDDFKRSLRPASSSGERISGDDLDLIGGQFALRLRQLVNQLPVALDQRDLPSAARRELEAKRTGAREKIQPAHAFKRRNKVLDPVEQRFAYAIGRRSQARCPPPAAVFASIVRR